MNRILCPTDFSDTSLQAIEFAVRIAEKHGSSLQLLHVVTEGDYNNELKDSGSAALAELEADAGERLLRIASEINKNSAVEYDICSSSIAVGDLIDEIQSITENESISLIVMGTEGAGDLGEVAFGSNTVKVLGDADVPVLCIPRESTYQDFSRILYGTDLDDDDRFPLKQVINFALPYDARIYLVHVSGPGDIDEEEYAEYSTQIKSYIDYKKLNIEHFETKEDVSIALEHLLNVHKANLLVLAHKKRNFLKSVFQRSLAKKMSYLTSFPLLVLIKEP